MCVVLSFGSGLISKLFLVLSHSSDNAFVSLVGSERRVPIKLLHDTGAQHSFIVELVLPLFLPDFVLMQGMEMGLNPVLHHFMVLDCELVQGIVPLRVHPVLPLDDVVMILGNDLGLCGLMCCCLL